MSIAPEYVILVSSFLLYISIMAGKAGYKLGVPVLLLFLLVGMAFGSDGFGLQFHNVQEAQNIGMVAMAIILFAGGLDTRFKDIRPVLLPGILLSTVGVILTALFTGIFIWLVSGAAWNNIHFAFLPSLLLAVTMSSTDSASVFAILSSQRLQLRHNLRPMLELESGSNDPMAYMITIVLIQVIQMGEASVGDILLSLLIQFLVGGAIGYAAGWLAIKKLKKFNITNQSLYPILLLSIALFAFAGATILKGNGYLTAYIMGIMVGNHKIPYSRATHTFVDGTSWLFQIIMFLMLGLLVNPHEMLGVAPVALLIAVFMIVLGRPLSVFLCLLPFRKYNWKARTFVSWVGLRGAAPIIFATYPVLAQVEGADVLFNIVFFITLVSLLVQGTTIPMVARWLDLSLPEAPEGNSFGIELPEDLDTSLRDFVVTKQVLEKGNTLSTLEIPKGILVVLVKRGEQILVPNGQLVLEEHDILLVIQEKETVGQLAQRYKQ